MRNISAPEADMLLVSQSSRNHRKNIMKFVPKIGLSIANYSRLYEIDSYYLDCQNFRDYYRDPYNKIQRPNVFKRHYGKCGLRFIDKNIQLLLKPTTWIREKQPVLYPLNRRRDFVLGAGIHLGGQHNFDPCHIYKH